MQPANLAITLRRRSPWEAMDLGLTMLQRWWRRVYAPHLAVAVPLMAAAIATGWFLERAWIALLLIWWLKPIYDRLVLHVLSRAVFGEVQSTGAVLRAAGQWLGTGLLGALTLHRIGISRAFNLPVRQLEGQAGRAARERYGVLGRRVGSYAAWLTLLCLTLEVFVLWNAFSLLAYLFLPAKADEGLGLLELLFGDGEDAGAVFTFGDAFAYALAVLLFEPFYVAGGFALYLNRRTLLEGWDIEVALRRIAQRHAVVGLVLIATFLAAASVSSPALAQGEHPKQAIREVLQAKEFGYAKDVRRWERREPAPALRADTTWLQAIGYAFARAGEIVLWALAGALLAYALWWAARMLPRGAVRAPAEPYRAPQSLFGMELAPAKLPPDVGEAAAALAREGRVREALSLLYRGALSELVHHRGVPLLASHTELEALRLARANVDPSAAEYLRSLTRAWRQCAYARRMPAADEVERLARHYAAAFA